MVYSGLAERCSLKLLWGGGGIKFYVLHETCLCRCLPLNKVMVFTELEVSRQAILLSVVVTD